MERRELIKIIAVLTGGTVIGADLFLSGCKSSDSKGETFLSEDDIHFIDEVAETIIPKTNTPGAKDAETGKFIALYVQDCYDEANKKIFKNGIVTLNEASNKKYGTTFLKIDDSKRKALLIDIDKEAKVHNESDKKEAHYFTLMKQLTLLGFFTSKPGATQVLRYNPVPGKYEGCIDYKKGETSWA